jgi:hypothetical protein
VGNKAKSRVLSGEESVIEINKLHGLAVAAQSNVIAEYGEGQVDLLYISFYQQPDSAGVAFSEMIKKIAHNDKGPFSHLIKLNEQGENAFFMIGIGASHYVFLSGQYIIWLQTYQSFGKKIPGTILDLYPLDPASRLR